MEQQQHQRSHRIEWEGFGFYKPTIIGASVQVDMRPYSITVHQAAEWKNKSGDFSITLDRPINSGIEFYLMEK